MVRVIDGYKSRIESVKLYEAAYLMTKQFFGNRVHNQVSRKKLMNGELTDIMVFYGPKVAVHIFPDTSFIEVNREPDFDKAFQLASRIEELVCKEFVIRTNYQHS